MITSEEAKQSAKQGIQHLGLDGNPDVAQALAASHIGDVIAVKRLDAPSAGYYLIAWTDQAGIRLIVQVDAELGTLASVAALQKPLPQLMVDLEEARRLAAEALGGGVKNVPQIVWAPCRESASPFQPFYRFEEAGKTVFVGTDGTTYTHLTPFGKGG